MPKVTEAHLEARRRQILGAAQACFARDGFHRTSMQAVCSEAGLSPGAVYTYFRSKDDIITAMTEEGRRRNEAIIAEARQQGDASRVMESLADSFFSLFETPEADPTLRVNVQLWGEALRSPEILEALRNRWRTTRTAFGEIVRQAQSEGQIAQEVDAEAVGMIMISLYNGLMLQKVIEPTLDVHKYVEAMKALSFEANGDPGVPPASRGGGNRGER